MYICVYVCIHYVYIYIAELRHLRAQGDTNVFTAVNLFKSAASARRLLTTTKHWRSASLYSPRHKVEPKWLIEISSIRSKSHSRSWQVWTVRNSSKVRHQQSVGLLDMCRDLQLWHVSTCATLERSTTRSLAAELLRLSDLREIWWWWQSRSWWCPWWKRCGGFEPATRLLQRLIVSLSVLFGFEMASWEVGNAFLEGFDFRSWLTLFDGQASPRPTDKC